ncbi:unnamed protein product [Caenorhabditis brenneri]
MVDYVLHAAPVRQAARVTDQKRMQSETEAAVFGLLLWDPSLPQFSPRVYSLFKKSQKHKKKRISSDDDEQKNLKLKTNLKRFEEIQEPLRHQVADGTAAPANQASLPDSYFINGLVNGINGPQAMVVMTDKSTGQIQVISVGGKHVFYIGSVDRKSRNHRFWTVF